MLVIDASSGKKTLDQVLKENELVLAIETVAAICDAIDMNIPKILVAIIKAPGGKEIDITASESYYKASLEKYMEVLIKSEKYELCHVAKEHIDGMSIDEFSILN